METAVPAVIEQPGKVALDVSYVLNYLKGKTTLVRMSVNSPSEPALLQYQSCHKVVIMPMMVQW